MPDGFATTAEETRDAARKVLDVSSGQGKKDKETWWFQEKAKESTEVGGRVTYSER